MFPVSLACGNTMVVKPSERDPGCTMLLMELFKEAGIPDGCVNVIHGAHEGLFVFSSRILHDLLWIIPKFSTFCTSADVNG